MMRYGGYGAYRFMGGLGMLVFMIFLVLIIFLVVRFSQGSNQRYGRQRNEDSALNILNERFARGEISEEEYTRKKNMLKD